MEHVADDRQPENRAGEDKRPLEDNCNTITDTFEEMGLRKDLLRGIFGCGFEKPSAIQMKAIVPLIGKKDVVGQAQSGSGKTATFVIGTMQNLDMDDARTQILVIAPTRELATQINNVALGIGTYLKVKTHLCTGGTRVADDRRIISEGVHLVVGTPGRVRDLLKRGIIDLSALKTLIIDEADEMLGLGFLEQINDITTLIPIDCQIGLFSATMNAETLKLAQKIMTNPTIILVKKEQLTLEGIKQYFISCANDKSKLDTLVELFGNMDINQCIIYANSQEKATMLEKALTEKNFVVSCIHGALEQTKRNEVMQIFRDGTARILVATDLIARGIDVQQVGLVINYELPSAMANYIHRIGRSGRFGRRGIAINLITAADATYMLEIQKFYQTQINDLPQDLAQLEN